MGVVAPHGGPVWGKWTWILLWTSFVQSGVAIILVLLRIYDVRQSGKKWRWDLILVSLATFFGILMELLSGTICALNGLGIEQDQLSELQIGYALEWAWIGTVFWAWCLCFGKLAIIALYIHITSAAVKRERIFLWTVGSIILCSAIVQTVLIVTTCDPPQKQWFTHLPGACPRRKVALDFDYFQGTFSAVTDFILALYPIPIVAKMSCSRGTKISVCAVMAGGLLPFAAAIGRTTELHVLLDETDATRKWVTVYLWGVTEIWFVIILGSLPPLRAYFARLFRLGNEEIVMPGTIADAPDTRPGHGDSLLIHTILSRQGSGPITGIQKTIDDAYCEEHKDCSKDCHKDDVMVWGSRESDIIMLDKVYMRPK